MDGEALAKVDGPVAMSLFQTGQDPRHYFVELIRERAQQEGVQFSDFETEYLSRSAAGDDEYASEMLDGIKGKQFEEFDSRISGLLWRAYQQDLTQYPDAKEKYREAARALANVDVYPNLGMFVCYIALEKSPEKKDSRGPTILLGGILLWFTYLLIRALLKAG